MDDKKEKIDEFLRKLDDHIDNKIADKNSDPYDSCAGFSSLSSLGELEECLYELFDIPTE